MSDESFLLAERLEGVSDDGVAVSPDVDFVVFGLIEELHERVEIVSHEEDAFPRFGGKKDGFGGLFAVTPLNSLFERL